MLTASAEQDRGYQGLNLSRCVVAAGGMRVATLMETRFLARPSAAQPKDSPSTTPAAQSPAAGAQRMSAAAISKDPPSMATSPAEPAAATSPVVQERPVTVAAVPEQGVWIMVS